MISWVPVQVFVKQTHKPGEGSFAAWVPWVPVRPSLLHSHDLIPVTLVSQSRFCTLIHSTSCSERAASDPLKSQFTHTHSHVVVAGLSKGATDMSGSA